MSKPSIADKKAQKILNDPKFQKDWFSHMKSFGPKVQYTVSPGLP